MGLLSSRGGPISATTRPRSVTRTVSPPDARRTYSLSLLFNALIPMDPSILPPDNVLAMIARFERAQSLGDVEALVVPLADLLDRAAEPKLVESFKAWIGLVVAQRFAPERDYVELQIGTEEGREMTTLIDRARVRDA